MNTKRHASLWAVLGLVLAATANLALAQNGDDVIAKKNEAIRYLGLIQLACALCWYRRLYRMGRCNAKQVPT